MNAQQIKTTAEFIEEEYYYLKLEELKYCFAQAQKGVYGKVYDRIDTSIIFEWLDKYIEERIGQVEKNNQNKNNEFKTQEYKNAVSSAILPALKQVTASEKKIAQGAQKPPQIEKLDRANEIMREFDDLFNEQTDLNEGSFRMVQYKNKTLSATEYLDFRLTEND